MAQYEEIVIDQGADWAMELHLANRDGTTKNLTGYDVAGKLKKTYSSDSDSTYTFGAIVATPATSGIVTLSLTNTQTDNLKSGKYVYDVELQYTDSAGDIIIERLLEGTATVTPSVTR